MSLAPLTDDAAIARLAERLDGAEWIGLDTEFLRERTYRPQLCLLQIAVAADVHCVDPLAGAQLAPLSRAIAGASVVKVMHAARQDLEVLWPVFGRCESVFDTQIAAALTGMSAQIGYSELVRRVLGITLAKSETRTDWSRRPLSAAQLHYAEDDVRHLGALREHLTRELERLGRLGWLAEELQGLADPHRLFVDPERAHERLRWSGELDPHRARLAQQLAAWRERRAIEKDRPRSWILEDSGLRALVLAAPRTAAQLAAVPDLAPGFVERSGQAVLAAIEAAQLPDELPPPPARSRPDPERAALVRRLSGAVQATAGQLAISPEILATRRELEALAAGARDLDLLRGWRAEVIGAPLLALL